MGLFGIGKKKENKEPMKNLGKSSYDSSFSSGFSKPEGNNPFKTPPPRPFSSQDNSSYGTNNQAGKPFGQGSTFQDDLTPGSQYQQPQQSSQSPFSQQQDYSQGYGSSFQDQSQGLQNNSQGYTGQYNSYQQQGQQAAPDMAMMAKNIEIMMTKLDAIRTAIENLDHRISKLESQKSSQEYKW